MSEPGEIDWSRCVMCGRPFISNAKPRLVLDEVSGKPVGRVHTGCRLPKTWHSFEDDTSFEDARRVLWQYYIARPQPDSDGVYANILMERGSGRELNDQQQELLDWWRQGPLKMPQCRTERIIATYRERLADYATWRATVVEEDTPETVADKARFARAVIDRLRDLS